MRLLLKWRLLGGHVHVDVFQSSDSTWQKNGSLIFDEPGFKMFLGILRYQFSETISTDPDGSQRLELQ